MPDYKDQDATATAQASKSPLSSLVRWLQIKKYQYEVTFSLYMLTPTEKCVFSTSSSASCPPARFPSIFSLLSGGAGF